MGSGKYLGIPSLVGRKKKAVFGYLKDRVWNKINSWSAKSLSKAGREVLVKSVTQAIPTYCMGVFLLPSSLTEELEQMMNSFWWGSRKGATKGINWLRWEHMLGKVGWKFTTNPDTIVSRVFKVKYFSNGNFLEAALGHNPSFMWCSIHNSQLLLKNGYRWRIGDQINLWLSPWLKDSHNPYLETNPSNEQRSLRVCDILIQDTHGWNRDMIASIMEPRDVSSILQIPLPNVLTQDSVIWGMTKDGQYTVRSGYHCFMEKVVDARSLHVAGNWSMLWKIKIPYRVKHFLWRMCRKWLPIRTRLPARGIQCSGTCPFCNLNLENEWHIFLTCDVSKLCWKEAGLWNIIEPLLDELESFDELFWNVCELLNERQRSIFSMTLWGIWKARNEKVWENKMPNASEIIYKAKNALYEWLQATTKQHAPTTVPVENNQVWMVPPTGGQRKTTLSLALLYNSANIFLILILPIKLGSFGDNQI